MFFLTKPHFQTQFAVAGAVTFQQFLDFTPVLRVILLEKTSRTKSTSGAVFKSGFNLIRGGFVSNTERPYFDLIWAARMPDAECGSAVEPGKRGENIVMTRQAQGANFT